MLQEMRKYSKSWAANILLGVLALAFVSWGVGDQFNPTNNLNPDPNSRFQETFDSGLPKLFKAWGIQMDAGKVVADLDLAIQVKQSEITTINQDQSRLRENMKALKGSPEEKALLQRYTRELNDQEDRLQAVHKEIDDTTAKRTAAKQQLDQMMQDLTFDGSI